MHRLFKIGLPKVPEKIETHVNGKKFKRLKKEAEEKKEVYERRKAKKDSGEDDADSEEEFWVILSPMPFLICLPSYI